MRFRYKKVIEKEVAYVTIRASLGLGDYAPPVLRRYSDQVHFHIRLEDGKVFLHDWQEAPVDDQRRHSISIDTQENAQYYILDALHDKLGIKDGGPVPACIPNFFGTEINFVMIHGHIQHWIPPRVAKGFDPLEEGCVS